MQRPPEAQPPVSGGVRGHVLATAMFTSAERPQIHQPHSIYLSSHKPHKNHFMGHHATMQRSYREWLSVDLNPGQVT